MKTLAISLLLCGAVAARQPRQPNNIIFTDDHGYADLNCQGVLDVYPDRATTLKRNLLAWSKTVQPKRLGKDMTGVGHKYFDWYLDHKTGGPTKAELEQQAAKLASLFSKCDANADGRVSLKEYVAAHPDKKLGPVCRTFMNLQAECRSFWLKPSP